MINKNLLSLPILLVTTIIACTYDQAEAPITCEEKTNINFTEEIVPILTTYCYFSGASQSCHATNGTAPTDFTTYQGVFNSKDRIKDRTIINKNMPPSYSDGPIELEECELKILQTWLDEGAMADTDTPCEPKENVSFANEIVPILTTYCYFPGASQSCHDENGDGPSKFTTYEGVFAARLNVKNRAVVSKNMPPSYTDGPVDLDECEIETLKTWLDEGALDN